MMTYLTRFGNTALQLLIAFIAVIALLTFYLFIFFNF